MMRSIGPWLLLLSCVVLAGCESHCVPVPATPGPGQVDPVNPSRMDLDVEARTLKLYPLDKGGHWLVILPGKPQEKIQGLEYRIPEDVALDEVQVYFVVPGVLVSNTVKLADLKKKT
jgi:hypothetical protein